VTRHVQQDSYSPPKNVCNRQRQFPVSRGKKEEKKKQAKEKKRQQHIPQPDITTTNYYYYYILPELEPIPLHIHFLTIP